MSGPAACEKTVEERSALLHKAYAAIRRARNARLAAQGMDWMGCMVDVDPDALVRMAATGLDLLGGIQEEVEWNMRDGSCVRLDRDYFMAMATAAAHMAEAFSGMEQLKRSEVRALDEAGDVLAWLRDPENLKRGWPGPQAWREWAGTAVRSA